MYDKRVIRGNTYALHVLPAQAQPDPIEFQKQMERKRRIMANRRIKEQVYTEMDTFQYFTKNDNNSSLYVFFHDTSVLGDISSENYLK